MLIDTHCHLDDPSLAARLKVVLQAARLQGVSRFVIPGVDPDGWDAIRSLAETGVGLFPAYGIHPLCAARSDGTTLARLAALAADAVAVGEIGLDYLAPVPRQIQQEAFRQQLRIALTAGVPVLIHCRRAFQDLCRILREEQVERVGGVMHAFSGSLETARECIGLGLCIAISGTVTYSNAVRPVEVVRQLPLERLVLETDAPDMTPEPFRGRPNEPAFMVETARKVAEIKEVSLDKVAQLTTANAERLFRLHKAH